MTSDISAHFEKARSELKSEHDSMVRKINEEINASKAKALTKI